ncbi:hypothetical protein K7X08_006124 [Anisodus acutangulus]|uniref:Uncharacterized protein n=1 Tax=Anisodus acutangulus TaxID=402998 RepID=A0A9Q1LSK8_9SOLA|nr:hypothetical protein K7X08_006124 [Anisodus acutangulus]
MAAGFGIRHYLCILFVISSIIFCDSARNSIQSQADDEMAMLQVKRRSLLSVELEDYGAPSANRNHYPGKGRSNGGRGRGQKNRP